MSFYMGYSWSFCFCFFALVTQSIYARIVFFTLNWCLTFIIYSCSLSYLRVKQEADIEWMVSITKIFMTVILLSLSSLSWNIYIWLIEHTPLKFWHITFILLCFWFLIYFILFHMWRKSLTMLRSWSWTPGLKRFSCFRYLSLKHLNCIMVINLHERLSPHSDFWRAEAKYYSSFFSHGTIHHVIKILNLSTLIN